MSGRSRAFEEESAEHREVVDAVFTRVPPGAEHSQVVDAFDAAMTVVWRRAERTRGAITHAANAGRVLHEASKAHPFLADVEEADHGIDLAALRSRADALSRESLESAAKLVLRRFLGVLGNLTADVLTAALHAELAALKDPPRGPNDEGRHR
jgi:hypothetical protein